MTKESFCSYEQGSRLKRLGFDIPCWCMYAKSQTEMFLFRVNNPENFNSNPFNVSAPTTEVAHRWLREVKRIFISVNPLKDDFGELCYNFTVYSLSDQSIFGISHDLYDNYEAAMWAALDYAIECAVYQYRKSKTK